MNMKDKIIKYVSKMVLPLSFIMICFSLFRDYINLVPNIFLIPIRIVLICGSIAMVSAGFITSTTKRTKTVIKKNKTLKAWFYYNYDSIIELTFAWYFFFYMILRLDQVSIIFDYIMLLLFGVVYGYRITKIANMHYKR